MSSIDSVEVVAGNWKPISLFQMLTGPKRFSDLLKLVLRVEDRVLTGCLNAAEVDCLRNNASTSWGACGIGLPNDRRSLILSAAP
ncbi:winged helix-turn-helix transcriptional regulator [Cognatishimia activa]|uniref:winged helix-turn-helix transcriptional regulator n=1 Tax=Cognatishimia activa TaxID=1715691 RepID=UPI003AF3A4E0